jgi:hypothetical protein
MCQSISKQTTESTSQDTCTEENTKTPLELVAFVVHADKIDRSWDETSFEDAE